MYDPITTVAFASVRHEDLMREVRQFQRQRHHEALVAQRRPARAAAMNRRLIRAVARGLVAALALSRS